MYLLLVEVSGAAQPKRRAVAVWNFSDGGGFSRAQRSRICWSEGGRPAKLEARWQVRWWEVDELGAGGEGYKYWLICFLGLEIYTGLNIFLILLNI